MAPTRHRDERKNNNSGKFSPLRMQLYGSYVQKLDGNGLPVHRHQHRPPLHPPTHPAALRLTLPWQPRHPPAFVRLFTFRLFEVRLLHRHMRSLRLFHSRLFHPRPLDARPGHRFFLNPSGIGNLRLQHLDDHSDRQFCSNQLGPQTAFHLFLLQRLHRLRHLNAYGCPSYWNQFATTSRPLHRHVFEHGVHLLDATNPHLRRLSWIRCPKPLSTPPSPPVSGRVAVLNACGPFALGSQRHST